MAIMARAEANYKPAPAGTHAAVCIDVVDLGELKVEYQGKVRTQPKVKLVFQLDELRDDGTPYRVSKRFTLSLHEKAALRKDLESWRGKPFTSEELAGFDLEVLLSVGCMLNVLHVHRDGSTFANIAAIMRLPRGMAAPKPHDYVREIDRKPEPAQSQAGPPDTSDWPGPSVDDVPL